jgi:hypothetical protein
MPITVLQDEHHAMQRDLRKDLPALSDAAIVVNVLLRVRSSNANAIMLSTTTSATPLGLRQTLRQTDLPRRPRDAR